MITHLEPDILECEVNWALENITINKTRGGDEIPVELFQILKDENERAALNMPTNLENSAVATGLEEVSLVFIPIPKKGNAKECSNYHTTALISHAIKVMIKILQAQLQQNVNFELPDVQRFRTDRGTRDQIADICWIIKKAR